ncbi:hypothetical protein [Sporosarcina sp. G11-34]|uniref:hypothetical protein n=1 Tax=Sporosarcina sp. G11-34 TaxID=2849605 RepID=UPI0022A8D80B|nr:hypothetical protein [Sporosarcina sp. G11-34]MCZ2258594.1 hypothetical protein [Sporosarcina sp. G11-34]
MTVDHSAELMKSMIAKLYNTITGDDEKIKLPRNKSVTWLLPGLPFSTKDFEYCAGGLGYSDESDIAETYNMRHHQAFALSRLLDFIPDVSNEFLDASMQQSIFTSTQDTISSVYGDVLKYSKVVHKELSEPEKEKLQRFRNLLSVTKEVKDIFTDEMKTVTEPGPMTLAYLTYEEKYDYAVNEYKNLLVNAQTARGNDPEAMRRVAEFANKAQFMRRRMESAEMAWSALGYKNEFKQIGSYIDQVTSKSMVLYKQDLINKYNNGLLSSALDGGSDFYYTTLIPGNFATSPSWTRFTFYQGDYENNANKKTSQSGAGGSAAFGWFSVASKAGRSKINQSNNQKSTNFRAELEFVQVPICRPWFDPGFFSMRSWTLDKLWDLNYDEMVSDGGKNPSGRLVAYPITALFVRNVKLKFDEADSQMQHMDAQTEVGGRVGFGPFSIKGSYDFGHEKRDLDSRVEGGRIDIDGIQLIGFINNIIPKSPNPHPDIKPEEFVGGDL